ncbi:phage protein NinX family protein [Achromobacter xylosoxidans]|uniref:phage protein NinX family protein n=1 Tax=Alcaligenes xylosoxydans xylosoxydans TaxID=85698 RepID=UPI003D2B9962
MKVSDLEGAELDAWVAKAHGMVSMGYPIAKGKPLTQFWGYDKREGVHAGPRVAVAKFRPSTDWSWGGPIIDSERISIQYSPGGYLIWHAHILGGASRFGSTPLIAAMRAYVASKYGEEVPND